VRYWISWYQPTEDERPLTFPPNEAVLGYWCSGQRCADDAWTLCALVRAPSAAEAQAAILKDWPEASEWRFVNERDKSWRPSARFPLMYSWMIDRMREVPT